jgi:cytochrome oxidase Cu insertion factor (SCO1/SenC/PrrC family)
MIPLSEPALRRCLWGLLILVMAWTIGAGTLSLLRERPAGERGAGEGAGGPPVYGRVPDFSLLERSGRPVEASALRGRVWIVNFIYTHCTDTCPLQSARMARLQTDYRDATDLRLISITVDPGRDTPQVLARYAARFGADPARWLFLTGEKGAIFRLAREGFRLGVEEPAGTGQSPLDRAFPPERSAAPGEPMFAALDVGRWTLDFLFGVAPALAHEGDAGGNASPPPTPPAAGPILHSSRFVLVDRQARIRGYYEGGDEEALRRLRRDLDIVLRETRP